MPTFFGTKCARRGKDTLVRERDSTSDQRLMDQISLSLPWPIYQLFSSIFLSPIVSITGNAYSNIVEYSVKARGKMSAIATDH